MKTWIANYNGNEIKVTNAVSVLSLYVNGEVQDEYFGTVFPSSALWGRLPSGEEIKLRVGGDFAIKISLFIDNKKIPCYKQ